MIKPVMMISLLAIAGLGINAANGQETDAHTDVTIDDSEIVSWREHYMALGEEIYDWACSDCHSTGKNGAPKMGDRKDWDSRSHLWSAVLLEHAKNGYLEMPSKGGHSYLSDRAVEAAGEYMLTKTYPELPRD